MTTSPARRSMQLRLVRARRAIHQQSRPTTTIPHLVVRAGGLCPFVARNFSRRGSSAAFICYAGRGFEQQQWVEVGVQVERILVEWQG